jgi:hypothetical protein
MSTPDGHINKTDPPPGPAQAQLQTYLIELRREFPNFRVVPKRGSRLSALLDLFLRVVTANRMRTFMTHYHTVIGDTLYVPDGWQHMSAIEKIILLRHERVHLQQRRRLTFGGMAFVYLVPLLPLGLAYGRARLEWEAYKETLRATRDLLGPHAARSPMLRQHILRRFCNAEYGWMWPFPTQLNRWYDQALRDLGC